MSSFLRSLSRVLLKFAELDVASRALSCIKQTFEPVTVFAVAIREFDEDYMIWATAFTEALRKPHLPAIQRSADQIKDNVFATLRKRREFVAKIEVPTCLLNFQDESPEDLKLPGSLTTEDLIKYMNDVIAMKEAVLIYMDKQLEYHEIGSSKDDDGSEREAVGAVLKDINTFKNTFKENFSR